MSDFSTPPRRPLMVLPSIEDERRSGRYGSYRNINNQTNIPSLLFPEELNNEDIMFSMPNTYQRRNIINIELLSNHILEHYEYDIEIPSDKTTFDYIEDSEINIQEYVNNDVNNIVIAYNDNYYISSKQLLSQFTNVNTTDNAIVFDCGGIGFSKVDKENPYVFIDKLGIILNDFANVISLKNAIAITNPNSGQYFVLLDTNNVLTSTVNDNVLNGIDPNSISASHCQLGKSAIVYDVKTFKPKFTIVNKKRKLTGGKNKKTNKKSSKKNHKKLSKKTYKRKSR